MHSGAEILVTGTILAGLFTGSAMLTEETVAFVRDINRKQQAHELQVALELYYMDEGSYPGELAQLVPEYIRSLPVDPKTGSAYGYEHMSGGESYALSFPQEGADQSSLSPQLSGAAAAFYSNASCEETCTLTP